MTKESRQIKFRVWARAWKPPQMIALSDLQIHGQKTIADALDYVVNSPNFILMEFSGLLDKNGREIYEGDIVEFFFFKKEGKTERTVAQVIYDTDSAEFKVRFDDKKGWPISMLMAFSDIHDKEWNAKNRIAKLELSVIGNVYENPDLLSEIIK